eukprot:m.96763 g.96763  ORF g.96763 m.96763 type:complete len:478 (-) comp13558_c0_seq3:1265-2698(-)
MLGFLTISIIGALTTMPVRKRPVTVPNMNGEYKLATTPGAPKGKSFPTNFMSYPGGVESFDAYHGPINSTYSQVWWTTSTDQLPSDIVERFDGKVMAIVGIEMDQVRRTPQGDVSVPINMAYNHHHNTMVVGKGARMEELAGDDPRLQEPGRKYMKLSGDNRFWTPIEHLPSEKGFPTSAMFDDGNGGEYRKSFHAYAPPFAQLVESPQTISGSAMQIDTWNRDEMNLTGSPFVPGPVPKHNLAPLSGPDAIYSGLLECPLTTRIKKLFDGSPDFNDTYSLETFKCSKTDPTNSSFCVQNDVNGISGDVPTAGASTAELQYAGITGDATSCESICANASSSCTGFTWISPSFSQPAWHKMCYLRKSGVMATAITAGIVTGTRGACGGAKQCPTLTASAKECFAAVASLPTITNMSIINNTVTSTDIPPGCSIVVAPDESKATAIFNKTLSQVLVVALQRPPMSLDSHLQLMGPYLCV